MEDAWVKEKERRLHFDLMSLPRDPNGYHHDIR